MSFEISRVLKKAERKIIQQISMMSRRLQPTSKTESFLKDLMEGLRDKSIDINEYLMIIRVYALQPITRRNGKRRAAANMLINLLSYVGEEEARAFSEYLDNIENRLNENGRSYFKK